MSEWKPLFRSLRSPAGLLLRWYWDDELYEGMGVTIHNVVIDANGNQTGDFEYAIAHVDKYAYVVGEKLLYLDEPPEVCVKRFQEFDLQEFTALAKKYPMC